MNTKQFKILNKKVIIRITNRICEDADELLTSKLFKEILNKAIEELKKRDSLLLNIFRNPKEILSSDIACLEQTLVYLAKMEGYLIPNIVKGADVFFRDINLLNDFTEFLYNFWRNFERFIICDSDNDVLDQRPYRTFNETIEKLTNLIRKIYRDIEENITAKHPRVYRQVSAGAEISAISRPYEIPFQNAIYKKLNRIGLIRQVLLYPPLVLDPPMNKRAGKFVKINKNPLDVIEINENEWLCYPAKVGPFTILIYFHETYFELGFSLCNLFELAEDDDLQKKPDAVYLFGVPGRDLNQLSPFPTMFYDDPEENMLIAAVPNWDEFGYFGYLKKMVLTLHNIKTMKVNRFPFHGALVKILLKGDIEKTILIIGDTGAGKSETLEAFRNLGKDKIKDIIIVADDMGSLDIDGNENIIGYGTEIGAFLRLDDLQPGYAFGQIDRSIILSANKVNSRIIMPITSFNEIIKGHKVDVILYANNYEEVDDAHPIIEQFFDYKIALNTFRDGAVMSKGTTDSHGLVHSYFANVFGPPQYKEEHEKIANNYFEKFFKKNLFVGQIRTRLGIVGFEQSGPLIAAEELLRFFGKKVKGKEKVG
ncbi:MAG: phosphoenolpyruvate carboxykinase [Candidatus Margulisiibacteriota bacterium]|jgi:hypothetical protein